MVRFGLTRAAAPCSGRRRAFEEPRTHANDLRERWEGDRRVVAFGDATVYVVSYDEFDLNYLERYDLPR